VTQICGYLVVRSGSFETDAGAVYRGVERDPWDLNNSGLATDESGEQERIRKQLAEWNGDISGLDISRSKDVALEFAAAARTSDWEIIVVRSPELVALKGTIDASDQIQWLGFDYFAVGEWSLVLHGVLRSPKSFARFVGDLNEYGLFRSADKLSTYVLNYREAGLAGHVEPIAHASAGLPVTAIEVGLVV
jgi:hypothetical protein